MLRRLVNIKTYNISIHVESRGLFKKTPQGADIRQSRVDLMEGIFEGDTYSDAPGKAILIYNPPAEKSRLY